MSGHSPLFGVGIKDRWDFMIEFDSQVYFHCSRKKDAAGGEPATRAKEVTGAKR